MLVKKKKHRQLVLPSPWQFYACPMGQAMGEKQSEHSLM